MSIAATAEPTVSTAQPVREAAPKPRPRYDGPRPADSPRVTFSPGGRLLHPEMTAEEKQFAIAIHLSPLAGILIPIFFLTPLVLWLIQKDKSAYLDDHGREMINFGITVFLANLMLGISFIGWPLMPILWVVWLISVIRGAVAAGNGEYFRYPLTIRFLS